MSDELVKEALEEAVKLKHKLQAIARNDLAEAANDLFMLAYRAGVEEGKKKAREALH